jgi:hypothetical protein
MNIDKVKKVVEEVYPLIEKYYGFSKYHQCTPWIEYHHNIYIRITGEDDPSMNEDFPQELKAGECDPDGEFDAQENTIVIYYPKMKSRRQIIETLIHEYQHYLQSPLWMKRYYNMGYDYENHPYELAATAEEKNYKLFT